MSKLIRYLHYSPSLFAEPAVEMINCLSALINREYTLMVPQCYFDESQVTTVYKR